MSSPSEINETAETALRVFQNLKEGVINAKQAKLLLEAMCLPDLAGTLTVEAAK